MLGPNLGLLADFWLYDYLPIVEHRGFTRGKHFGIELDA